MPQFRFRVLTPDGRVRKGSLTSASLEDARNQIELMGLSVVELTPVEEAPLATGRKTLRAPHWTRHLVGYPMAAFLACLGLVWGLATWKSDSQRSRKPIVRDAAKMAEECKFSGEFEGRVDGGPVPAETMLVLQFPEIPYQVSQPWPQGSSCHLKIQFQAARQPSLCLISLQKGRSVLAQSKLEPLLEGKSEFQLRLEVGTTH
ncbi:MAG: hypothetical protein U0931_24555 [Vulcanimicrobiota bacterium]